MISVVLESDPVVGVELESNLESNLPASVGFHQIWIPNLDRRSSPQGSYTRTAMKLLTHNMLMSPGTKNGYPLAIEVEKMETVETEFNGEFTARMVEKLDYAALLSTLRSVSDAGFSAREHVAGTAVCSCL